MSTLRQRLGRIRYAAFGPAGGPPPRTREQRIDFEVQQVREAVEAVVAQPGPVVAGPFFGEVGYELLYWIPYLRWVLREYPALQSRLVLVSRGGTASWSAGVSDTYVDLFDVSTPAELMQHRTDLKQREAAGAFDAEIARRVRERLGAADGPLLHPSVMFHAYYRIKRAFQMAYVDALQPRGSSADGLLSVYEPIEAPPASEELLAVLPDEFTAVRFYACSCFPDTTANRSFVRDVTDRLALDRPVVLLNNGLRVDEHEDVVGGRPDVIDVSHLMHPKDNLAVQTAVLTRARAYVGTYGGLSYLGPFVGVSALGFLSAPRETHAWHLHLAQALAALPGWGALGAVSPHDLELVQRVVGVQALPGSARA